MKKLFLTLVLLVGIAVGLFAQKLTYQAVVRNNNQQLVVNTDVKATVTITFSTGNPYSEEVNATTNIHGLLSFEFGGDALNGRNWEGATIAVKVVNAATPSTVYVNDGARPVSAVPYALSVNGQSIQNYLTEHHYVTETTLDGRHYLTSDSAVITTMQGNITTNTTNIATNAADIVALANRVNTFNTNVCDSVKNCDFSDNTSIKNMLQQLTARLDSLEHVISSQDSTINALNEQVEDLLPFECGKSKLKDAEGNKYNTVAIGNQCWMAQNLRTNVGGGVYPKYPEGHTNAGQMVDDSLLYGRLYSWTAMMNGKISSNAVPSGVQGICPTGWHVPSDAEWTALTTYVNIEANGYRCNVDGTIANALSYTTGWQNSSECTAGYNSPTLNATGFSAVPAGYCSPGTFYDFGLVASFWSATEEDDSYAYYRILYNDASKVNSDAARKGYSFSVRCLRDAGVGGPTGDNACCSELGARLDSLEHVISSQDSTINALNEQVNPFTCGTSKVKDVDNNEYPTVKIGNQCWMAQNLRTKVGDGVYPKYPNGHEKAGQMVDDSLLYGRLYTWNAMMKEAASTNYPDVTTEADTIVQGICPTGWHVPSIAEFDTLTNYVNIEANGYRCDRSGAIAKALASTTGWSSSTSDGCNAGNKGDKANATGFSAVPAGSFSDGSFDYFGSRAYFWSATQSDPNNASHRILYSDKWFVDLDGDSKGYGFSVRCLRD